MMALLSMGFTACNQDFPIETAPQGNAEESTFPANAVEVTSTTESINLADYLTEAGETVVPIGTVTLKADLPANTVLRAEVEISRNEDFSKSVTIPANSLDGTKEISVMPGTMEDAYFNNITRNPATVDLYVRTILYTVTGGTAEAIIGKPGENYFNTHKVTFTPIKKVQIADSYYLIGGPGEWNNSKAQKFSHSDKDVYTDPVFTYTFKSSGSEMWFTFGDEAAIDAVGEGTWNQLYGTKGDSKDLKGSFDRRAALGGDHTLCVDGSAKFYKITIDMMEMTYEITPINYTSYIYVPGNAQGWKPESAAALYSPNSDGVYTGFVTLDGGFKFTKERNWNEEYNWNDFSTVTPVLDNGAGTDTNLYCNKPGLYYVTVDVAARTITAVKVEKMGIIGDFNGWGGDVEMTWNAAELCFEATGAGVTANGWKFRVNSDWAINLGANDTVEPSTKLTDLVGGGKNLGVAGNTVKLYPCRTASEKIYCTVE